MKIGILTYHRALNYGAYLQACALCNRLNEENDIEAEIIDFQMNKEVDYYTYNWSFLTKIHRFNKYRFLKRKEKSFKEALNDNIMKKSVDYCLSDNIEDFIAFVKNKYDLIVAGSDEIWKFNNFRGFPNPYWLIGDLGCRKMSYAASSRQDFSLLSETNRNIVKNALSEFDYIGVRDELTKMELQSIIPDKEIHLCCDPSFIYDFGTSSKSMNEIMVNQKGYDINKKNAFVMSDNRELNRYLYEKMRDNYNMISVASYNKNYINMPALKPSEWLEMMQKSDVVFTTYFHGTCFSIVNKIPFLSFGSKQKSSKIESLFVGTSLEKHYIDNLNEFIENDDLFNFLKNSNSNEWKNEFENKCTDYLTKCRTTFTNDFLAAIKSII